MKAGALNPHTGRDFVQFGKTESVLNKGAEKIALLFNPPPVLSLEIIGREYLSLSYFYNKEIARVQSQWGRIQAAREMEDLKTSKHLQKLYRKKNDCIKDYIHKMTRYITNYCVKNDIHTVVIGDIKGIRKERNLGRKTNQKLHSLPYARIYMQLEYKLKMKGICLIRQEESYSSQCPPQSEKVSHIYAEKRN